MGEKCQEGKNDQWHKKLEEGKRKKMRMKDREIMQIKEQQEQAFPQGEAIWEMTMTATWRH